MSRLEIWHMGGVCKVLACGRQITTKGGVAGLRGDGFEILRSPPISRTGEARDLKYGLYIKYVTYPPANEQTTVRRNVARVM